MCRYLEACQAVAVNYTAAGSPVVCIHCGGEDLEQRYWWTAAAGMGLVTRLQSRFIKHGKRSLRFLACLDCGMVMSFIPDARRGPSFGG